MKAMTGRGGGPVFRLFMEEEEEAETVWETGERAVVDVDVLKNCLLGKKTGQGDRNGDWDQILSSELAKTNWN